MVKLYLVGGYVRDLEMSKHSGIPMSESGDRDYAVEANSFEEMKEWLINAGADIKVEAPGFFTIRAMLGGRFSDFTLCRTESNYTDGRHPDNVQICTIYDDLARRDFTINAMAIDCETGKLIDPFNGVEDIKHGRIVCVGNAAARMSEDYLRLLRAVRFCITLRYSIDADIVACLHNTFYIDQLVNTVSEDRIREELTKMFKKDTSKSLAILSYFPALIVALFSDKIWLKPTMEKRH